MQNIEESLKQLPKIEPNKGFVSYLESKLVAKHVLISRGKPAKKTVIFPVFALGSSFIIILLISGILYQNYLFSKKASNSSISNSYEDGYQQESINDNTRMFTNSSSSAAVMNKYNFEGVIFESNSNPELYELRNKGEIIYYVSGNMDLIKDFIGRDVVIQGDLNGSFNNINIIEVKKVNLKEY